MKNLLRVLSLLCVALLGLLYACKKDDTPVTDADDLTWSALRTPVDTSTDLHPINYLQISASGLMYFYCEEQKADFFSSDYGATWHRTAPLPVTFFGSNNSIGSNPYAFISPTNVFYTLDVASYPVGNRWVSQIALYHSFDTGATWQRVQAPEGGDGYNGGLPVFDKNGVVYMSTTAGLYRSSDEGASWTFILADSGTNISVAIWSPAPGVVLYADSSAPMMRSTDYGATWNVDTVGLALIRGSNTVIPQFLGQLPNGTMYVTYYVPGSETTGGTGFGVFSSGDNGATWQRADNGLPYGQFSGGIVALPGGAAILSGNGGSYFTSDGVSWTDDLILYGQSVIGCDPQGYLYSYDTHTIYKSTTPFK